jgi:hypothetical protein
MMKARRLPELVITAAIAGSIAVGCPAAGDITYYAPWGTLAIFRKDFRYSDGLIKLGKIDGAVAALDTSEELEATIELIK